MRWLLGLLLTFFLILGFIILKTRWSAPKTHPSYKSDLNLKSDKLGPLKVGFSKTEITPTNLNFFADHSRSPTEKPAGIGTFYDPSSNEIINTLWLAGFQRNRPAAGISDPLWARAVAIDDGSISLVLVSLDAIGILHNDVVDIRTMVPEQYRPDYILISATNTHGAPDLIGIWGSSEFSSGISDRYLAQVKSRTVATIVNAMKSRVPAKLKFAQSNEEAESLVEDTRPPEIKDPRVRVMQAISMDNDSTLGTLVSWANKPAVMGNTNQKISSDFAFYLRDAMEEGILNDDPDRIQPGIGGICIFFNGAIGGTMTTTPQLAIPSVYGAIRDPGAEKSLEVGEAVARIALKSLRAEHTVTLIQSRLRISARTIELPLDNPQMRLAMALGIVPRSFTRPDGWPWGGFIRSEMAAFAIGNVQFLSIPGEIFPEIVNGGVSAPVGRDFNLSPQEVPPFRKLMNGEINFILGLSNDFIGPIIPMSQWDSEPPWLYLQKQPTHGEGNSLGPNTAREIYRNGRELLQQLNEP